ncbi:MAG: NAD(P) transhydrogenase subunit alpha [Alphaproteobacteria bacterium]|nr:NAD(P) transhydrogenase subunit alpha [Alphaproteobacteria bacterium]
MPETEKTLSQSAADLASTLKELSDKAAAMATDNGGDTVVTVAHDTASHAPSFLISGITVFVLACIVGYYVVWRVTPALHSPLMGITNAISSVIIVGAIMAVSPVLADGSGGFSLMAFLGIILASVNIFGGFIITRRMLHMFKKKGG